MTLRSLPLKANHCFASLDTGAQARAGGPKVRGFFLQDTRHLSRYEWRLPGFDTIAASDGPRRAERHLGRFRRHRQELRARRTLVLRPDGFDEELELINEDDRAHELVPELLVDADFRDIFELRGRRRRSIGREPVRRGGLSFEYRAQDDVRLSTRLRLEGFRNGAVLRLGPRERRTLTVAARFESGHAGPQRAAPLPGWTPAAAAVRGAAPAHVKRAFEDVEMLTSSSADGPQIAAGIPNFVTLFGRDALLSAWFLLPAAPDMAAGALRGLARHQGSAEDAATREAPGKIPHEIRCGEMARTGDVPFGRYYGTADASALYVMLMRDHATRTNDAALVRELAPNWRAALRWCEAERGSDGLLRYPSTRSGRGLVNNSWKDSDDSMSFADGRLAEGRIAVVEVQGYLAAALAAGADLETSMGGDPAEATRLRAEAATLRELIDERFWNERLGMHALAVCEDGRQCDVASSNPGHLLWAGVLTRERAERVASRLMRPDLWSGWGLRTLAEGEARYGALSYHNGSVWPHDTGLFAAGLARYGLVDELERVREALRDLALAMPDHRLPELVGGYDRDGGLPPLPYVETCSPQAWAAAALVGAEMGFGEGGVAGGRRGPGPARAGRAARDPRAVPADRGARAGDSGP